MLNLECCIRLNLQEIRLIVAITTETNLGCSLWIKLKLFPTTWNFRSVTIYKIGAITSSILSFLYLLRLKNRNFQRSTFKLTKPPSTAILKTNPLFPQLGEEVAACQGSLILQSLGLVFFPLLNNYCLQRLSGFPPLVRRHTGSY